jgi:hypothetical protein
VGFVSARVAALGSVLVLFGCGTVSTGQDIQIAPIVYDSSYFYCAVEPMIFAEHCGPGESSDPPSGCHFSLPMFHLTDHAKVPCNGNTPDPTMIPAEAQSNYTSASREMYQNQLLNRPTQVALHPRKIFDIDSQQATLIRTWATKYTSQ